MLDWDDLRIFLASARTASFTAAALRLRMDATTVGRRVQRLEDEMGTALFVRSPRGLELTAAGARVHELGSRMESLVETTRHREDSAAALGSVRVSVPEGFGTAVLGPALPAFMESRPGLSVELVANSGLLSPSTREVDLAVSLSPPKSARLKVERLADYELGLYGSVGYLARFGRPAAREDLTRHRLIGYIDDLIYAPELRYLDEVHPGLELYASSSSIQAQLTLVTGGAGLAVLPNFLCAEQREIERVLPKAVSITRTFWMSTHKDIANAPRVRAVRDWLRGLVSITPDLTP